MADIGVAVIVPMLGRPHTVDPLVSSLRSTAPTARILFVCTPGDAEVMAEIDRVGCERIEVDGPRPGDYARKINAGYRYTTEPLIFTGACDLRFHESWLEHACRRLTDGIGVVGTNDLGSRRVRRGVHATHSLVTRAYVDEFGTIDEPGVVLHEGYPHEYVDDELVQTAMYRKAWAFAADSRVEHLHPAWGKAPTDAMYEQQADRMRAGRRLYDARRRLWT